MSETVLQYFQRGHRGERAMAKVIESACRFGKVGDLPATSERMKTVAELHHELLKAIVEFEEIIAPLLGEKDEVTQ